MKRVVFFILVTLFIFWLPFSIKAAERITDFKSDVTINIDGSLTVKETISAVAEHDKINHGIYRDLILDYQGPDKIIITKWLIKSSQSSVMAFPSRIIYPKSGII